MHKSKISIQNHPSSRESLQNSNNKPDFAMPTISSSSEDEEDLEFYLQQLQCEAKIGDSNFRKYSSIRKKHSNNLQQENDQKNHEPKTINNLELSSDKLTPIYIKTNEDKIIQLMYDICLKHPNISAKIEKLIKPIAEPIIKQEKSTQSNICTLSSSSNEESIINRILDYHRIDLSVSTNCSVTSDIASKSAAELLLPRNPLICPIDDCKIKHVFLSDYAKHMMCDHVKIQHEYLRPGQCSKFMLNQMETSEKNVCQSFYLVTEKIRDLGASIYKNYLPILVMSKIVSLSNILESKLSVKYHENDRYHILWLTGIKSTELPTFYTVTALDVNQKFAKPNLLFVKSGKIHSLRDNQDIKTIYRNGSVMFIPIQQKRRESKSNQNSIEIQVVIH